MTSSIATKRSGLVQATLDLKNKSFSLREREHFYPIYDVCVPEIVLMFGRQCEKSTTISNWMMANAMAYPFFTNLYVAPTQQQCSDFSTDKLTPLCASKFVRDYYYDPTLMAAVMNKQFRNGSQIKLRSCFYTADTIRGITSDAICIDEVQDILSDNIPVIRESMSHSPFKWMLKSGTPKTSTNTLYRSFRATNMCEWIIKCDHCNKHNVMSYESIGPKGLICTKCKSPVNRRTGRWAKTNTSNLWGFRFPQPLRPDIAWEEIWEKYTNYPIIQFNNEVLALPHDASAKPITEDQLRACCGTYTFDKIDLNRLGLTYAGLDYGRGNKSYTVFTVIEKQYDGHPKLIYAEKFKGAMADPNMYIPYIHSLLKKYRVRIMGADCGDGFMQNLTFQQTLGPKGLFIFYASDNLQAFITWNAANKMFVHNRTGSLGARFREMQLKACEFPVWKQFEEYAKDILAVYTDYRSNDRVIYYDHEPDEPDDFLHSYNHALMAMKLSCGEYRVDSIAAQEILKR